MMFDSGASEVIGEGVVWQGMVTPPAFLSEAEVCQVIREEAIARGVDLGLGGMLLIGVVPLPDVGSSTSYSGARKTWHGPFRLDGYDERIGAGFEYVSKEDIDQWTQQAMGEEARVAKYRFHQTANRLTASMQEQMRSSWGHIGIFYDPGTTFVDPQMMAHGMKRLISKRKGNIKSSSFASKCGIFWTGWRRRGSFSIKEGG